jgi:hypothetical protein
MKPELEIAPHDQRPVRSKAKQHQHHTTGNQNNVLHYTIQYNSARRRMLLERIDERGKRMVPRRKGMDIRLPAETWQYIKGKIEDSIPIREVCRSTVKRSVRSGLVKEQTNEASAWDLRLPADAWQYIKGKIEDSIPIREVCRSTVKRSVRYGLVLTTERERLPALTTVPV